MMITIPKERDLKAKKVKKIVLTSCSHNDNHCSTTITMDVRETAHFLSFLRGKKKITAPSVTKKSTTITNAPHSALGLFTSYVLQASKAITQCIEKYLYIILSLLLSFYWIF